MIDPNDPFVIMGGAIGSVLLVILIAKVYFG